jgi:hypothetical protein
VGWEISPGDGSQCDDASPALIYLYGVLIILAVVIAIGEWFGRGDKHGRSEEQRRSDFRAYIAMAVLWPLFVMTVIFVALWALLTRRA